MKNIFYKIITHLAAYTILILALPIMLGYTLISSFWKIFGVTIISFVIIALFGGTLEECIKYSSSLGFFVGVILMIKEKSKE